MGTGRQFTYNDISSPCVSPVFETNNNNNNSLKNTISLPPVICPNKDFEEGLIGGDLGSPLPPSPSTPPVVTDLPSGYISVSSFARSFTAESERLFDSPFESDFWSPSLNFLSTNKRRRKISMAQEALPTLESLTEEFQDNQGEKLSPSKLSELLPSLGSISLPKLPEKSWFCNTCRKPKDECRCMCVIS